MPSKWSCSEQVRVKMLHNHNVVCVTRIVSRLSALASENDGALTKCLQNISVLLGKCNHWELSFGYALTACQLHPHAPYKAAHRAALACTHMGQAQAAVYFAATV